MEEKLKTLKDLMLYDENKEIRERLREEAIKWINVRGGCGMNINQAMKGDIIGWIEHFFNLTKADLEISEFQKKGEREMKEEFIKAIYVLTEEY